MVRIFIEFALIFNHVSSIWAQNMSGNSSDREHKVHNIVLYPDRHSWCRSTPIVQEVGHPGCGSVKTENNVCVGTCFSYVVPRAIPERLGDLSPYCDSCQPTRVSWKKVTLECKEGVYQNQNLTKHVEFIHDCHCGSCKSMNDRKEYEEGDDTDDDSSEDTESLITASSTNATSEVNHMLPNSSQSEFKTAVSRMLLKTMNHEDESVLENAESKGLHCNVWKILLEKIETAENSTNATNFNDIVKSVEDEHKVKFNHKRLKQVLLKLKKLGGNRTLSNLFNKTLIDQADNSSRITETRMMTTMMTTTTTTTTTIITTRNDSKAPSTTGASPQVIVINSHPLELANNETKFSNQSYEEKLATTAGVENRTAI